MKSFKFRYSLIVWILLCLVIALSVAGLIWNVYNVIAFIDVDNLKTITFIAICVLTAFLTIFAVSVAVYGRYVIKNGSLTSYFGFAKTKFDICDVVQITLFKKSNKLVTYFSDSTYTVIVISPEEYSDFILAMREVNPKIIYDTQIDGEDTPN